MWAEELIQNLELHYLAGMFLGYRIVGIPQKIKSEHKNHVLEPKMLHIYIASFFVSNKLIYTGSQQP